MIEMSVVATTINPPASNGEGAPGMPGAEYCPMRAVTFWPRQCTARAASFAIAAGSATRISAARPRRLAARSASPAASAIAAAEASSATS